VLPWIEVVSSRAECRRLEAVVETEMTDDGRSGVVGGGFPSSSLESLAGGADGRGGGICDVLGEELLGPLYGVLAIVPWVCWEG